MKIKSVSLFMLVIIMLFPFSTVQALSTHNVYYVQAGIFGQLENANRVFNSLHNSGLTAYKQPLGKNTTVFVGYYSTKREAESALQQVNDLGYQASLKLASFRLKKYQKNTVYTVQLGVFSKEQNANRLYDNLRGYQYGVQCVSADKYIKVQVGDYSTAAEANDVLNEILKLGYSGFVVEEDLNHRLGLNSVVDEPDGNSGLQAKNYILRNDQYFEGLYGSYTMFFYKNENWNLDSAYVELKYQKSPIVSVEPSTITVLINDVPIYSEFLQKENSVRIKINRDYINDGYNSITFHSFSRITDLPCEDDLNPANWLKILGSTFVHLEYSKRDDSTSLADFPYPYMIQGLNMPLDAEVLLPPNPDEDELAALMMLSQALGRLERFYNKDITVKRYGENDLSDSNIIVISKKENLPAEYISYFAAEELALTNKNTVIREIISPYNPDSKILFLIWGSAPTFNKALNALLDPDIVKQMKQSSYSIADSFAINAPAKAADETITFKEAGYSGVQVEGLFEHNINYQLQIPSNWKPVDGANIHLKLRYSEVLDFDRSLVTVLVNDVPIGSSALAYDRAHDDTIELLLTEDSLSDSGNYSIAVKFSLYLDDTYCETRVDSSVWAYVVEDSYLYFPHEENKNLFLRNYEGVFLKDDTLSEMNFILPANYSMEELEAAAAISSYLGRFANSFGKSYVHTANALPENLNNCIAIFSAEQGKELWHEINDYAFVKYDLANQNYQSTSEIPLIGTDNIASLQLVPYHSGKMLIVSAVNKVGMDWAKKFLTETETIYLLNGDVAMINNQGMIKSAIFDPELKANLGQPVFSDRHNYQQQNRNRRFKLKVENIKLAIVIFSVLIMGIGVVIYWKR